MGNPTRYYVRALQYFCRAMHFNKEHSRSDRFFEIEDSDILEKEIDKFVAGDRDESIFTAGRTYEVVLQEAEEEGCDAMNAAAGGLYEFMLLFIPEIQQQTVDEA